MADDHRRRHAGQFIEGVVGLCPATGKLRYASRAAARSHARRLGRGPDHRPRPGAGPLEAYRCDACGCDGGCGWHIGHRPAWKATEAGPAGRRGETAAAGARAAIIAYRATAIGGALFAGTAGVPAGRGGGA
jgi:hypothetical protein